MGSNFFLKYKADAIKFEDDALSFTCNDGKPTFYSLWRYAAAQNKIEAWERAGETVGTDKVKELLRLVTECITEHSVVWKPEHRVFELAVPQLSLSWWDGA